MTGSALGIACSVERVGTVTRTRECVGRRGSAAAPRGSIKQRRRRQGDFRMRRRPDVAERACVRVGVRVRPQREDSVLVATDADLDI